MGAYGRSKNEYDDLGKNTTELNHTPTKSSVRKAGFDISKYRQASFRMIKDDHRKLISKLTTDLGKKFRLAEESLLKSGKFEEAFDLTVAAVRKQYGNKYDAIMKQAKEYYMKEVVPILQKQFDEAKTQ